MRPKCGHKSGLRDNYLLLNEKYAENMKKIVGAV